MFEFLSKYKRTDFRGGYLHADLMVSTPDNTVLTVQEFVPPRKIDNRDQCVSSSNQGQTPHCAGYATAGHVEIYDWKKFHYPQQVDGDIVYSEAKKIDGNNNDGTSLFSAAKGAINAGFIKGTPKFIGLSRKDVMFAIHEFDSCVLGFIITEEWNYVDKTTGSLKIIPNARKLGGHGVLGCGYSESEGVYVQNSWGINEWGIYGFAIIPWSMFDIQLMGAIVIVPE